MTLIDHQTGRDIINPYLLISANITEANRFAINTETFGSCQDWLILRQTMSEDLRSENFRSLPDDGLAVVSAVIGNYNCGLPLYGIHRTVRLVGEEIHEQELGFVPFAILRQYIPKVYEDIVCSRSFLKSLIKPAESILTSII
jgi:hypothetical protein